MNKVVVAVGRKSSAVLQSERQDRLEELEQERDAAARHKDDIEARLEEARKSEGGIRKELHAAKNELEQLRGQDMKNVKAWQEAQDKSERFLTKVSLPALRFLYSFSIVPSYIFCSLTITASHVYVETRK